MWKNRLAFRASLFKAMMLVSSYSLSAVEVKGQEIPVAEFPFLSAAANIEEQLRDSRQFVEDSLRSSQEILQKLTAINPQTGLPSAYDPDGQSGVTERMKIVSEAQSEFIEDYAGFMQLRTSTLFDLWGDRAEDRAMVFMQTGSLYDIPALPPIEVDEQNPVVSLPPDYFFPGFDVPPSGFFGQSQQQP